MINMNESQKTKLTEQLRLDAHVGTITRVDPEITDRAFFIKQKRICQRYCNIIWLDGIYTSHKI